MRFFITVVSLILLLSGCTMRYADWLAERKAAREDWDACAINATEEYSKKYYDNEMIAKYAVHGCEEWKLHFIEIDLKHPGADSKNVQIAAWRYEQELIDRMKMRSIKFQEDQNAEFNKRLQAVPLEFN
jgi:hypothetical protein